MTNNGLGDISASVEVGKRLYENFTRQSAKPGLATIAGIPIMINYDQHTSTEHTVTVSTVLVILTCIRPVF